MDFYLKISGMQYFGVFSDHLDATASLSTNLFRKFSGELRAFWNDLDQTRLSRKAWFSYVADIGDDHCLWLLMSKILCEFSP